MNHPYDVHRVRRQFPGLSRQVGPLPAAFFDGPAGSQVPGTVIEAMREYLAYTNANHGGVFATSSESDAILDGAHRALADFLGSSDPDLVCFGANMTTITLSLSRALARTWKAGDEILVTHLDHDANYTPWILAARDAGATVREVGVHPEDCTLDLDDLRSKLSTRTRLLAMTCASNASGSRTPIEEVVKLVHDAGGQVYLDAVHFAPHLPIDVEAWNCDYLVCSAYKFFGPHIGVLWGRREHLAALTPYKLRPAPDSLPGRWMTGTQAHEAIAGARAAVDYLADLGRMVSGGDLNRREGLLAAFGAIEKHEQQLTDGLLRALSELPQIKVWGITDPARMSERVPTVSFTHARLPALEVARHLGTQGLFVWHGNFYALPLTEYLGLEPQGMVRAGILHYNTSAEVERLVAALRALES